MHANASETVRLRLQRHASQGVFQGLSETAGRRGKTTFNFRWLMGQEFRLLVDPNKQLLVAQKLLPEIETYSFIDRDLRRFVTGRSDPALPSHRRVDADLFSLTYTNRKQTVSLFGGVPTNDYAYATKSVLTAINDLFAYLHLNHINYLHENFSLPEE